MGLTDRKEEQLKKMPQIETKLTKSKDGRFLIHRTIITSIRPIAYYETVIANNSIESEDEINSEA